MEKINKYHQSKIYGLYTIDTNQLCYIGSTYNILSKRFYQHKHDSKKKSIHLKIYQYINSIGGIENIKIILIENVKCETKEELLKIEQQYIIKNKDEIYNTLNACGLNKKEYYENNKEAIKEYKKIYYENNKERLCEINKIYYENNKERLCEIIKKN